MLCGGEVDDDENTGDDHMDRQEWLLKRNCSLTPRQTIAAFAVLCALSFGIAFIVVLVHGTWLVFAFALAEMIAVAAAFLHYARHAMDCERIVLGDGCLLIEQSIAGRVQEIRLEPCWLHVTSPRNGRDMIALEARGVKVEIGRFITEQARQRIAKELRLGLHSRGWA